jgi:hypothetical protein
MGTRYMVSGEVVICMVHDQLGAGWRHLYRGSWIPEDAPQEWIDRHLRKGLIEPVPGTEPVAEAAPEPEVEKTVPERTAAPRRSTTPRTGG